MATLPNGYEIPIHKSLTQDILLGGVPRTYALLNGAVGAGLGIGGGSWYIIPLFIFIHMALAYAHRTDFQFVDCLRRFFYQKKYYST